MRVQEESKMRGQATNIAELVEQAKWSEKQGNKPKAVETYESALRLIAEPPQPRESESIRRRL